MRIIKAWKSLVDWFEHGDLVPLIVVVSAVHYTAILREHDHAVTATAIGLMVDLGHYRTVRAFTRYGGANKRELLARLLIALAMSVVAFAYQQRFYNDLWLSLPLPFLIAALAWLNQKDQRTAPRSERAVSETPAKPAGYTCETCGQAFATNNARNAHQRVHAK